MKKKRNPKNSSKKAILKWIIWALILFLVVWLGVMSVREYGHQTEALGIIVCSDEGCIKTMHIHADVEFDLCGQAVTLPRETGPLDGLHMHKEKNYLHFHDKVRLEPGSKAQLFDKRLSVREVIDLFELTPEKYCETDPVIRVLVNGVEQAEGLEYNWQDGDQIQLIYQAND